MRTRDLTAAERRMVAAGGTIILALVIGFRGVPAWNAWRVESRESAAVLAAEVARTEAMYSRFPTILDSLEARIARLREMRPMPLVARDAGEAGAALADLVGSAARASSVEVRSLEVQVDNSGTDVLPRVSVVMDAIGDVTGLAMLLTELEASAIALAVPSLFVAPQSVETPAHEIETLTFRIRVEGLAMPREPQRGGGQ